MKTRGTIEVSPNMTSNRCLILLNIAFYIPKEPFSAASLRQNTAQFFPHARMRAEKR